MNRSDPTLIEQHTPSSLRDLPQWVCWRIEDRDGKPAKIPCVPGTTRRASSTRAEDWRNFDEALAALRADSSLQGVGFVFAESDSFCGVDLDDCRNAETGELVPWAIEIIERLNSYTEISPSGTGVKIFMRGRKPGPKCRKPYESGEVEMYDHDRFFTVTGWHLESTPDTVEDRQAEIDELYAKVFGKVEAASSDPAPRQNLKGIFDEEPAVEVPAPELSDDEIIHLLTETGKNKDKFSALWQGRWNDFFNSPSNADSAVAFKLAYYTKDAGQINRIFRQSGLFRDKWDEMRGEQTYGQMTIAKALSQITGQYQPRKRPTKKPAPSPEGIDAIIAKNDIHQIFEQVPLFAALDKAALGQIKIRLKEVFGHALNMNDFISAVREARRNLQHKEIRDGSDLPSILTSGRQLRHLVEDSLGALVKANDPPVLFNRGGSVAILQNDDTDGMISIKSLSSTDTPVMKDHLTRSADFYKAGNEGEDIPCNPPYDVASVILSRSDHPFPPLDGVTQSPVIRVNGSILLEPGYDPLSRLYYHPGENLNLPVIPEHPTPAQVRSAVELLREMVCDFPFTEDAGRVNFFALLLGVVMRPLIDGCVPLALIDAPRQGTGKGLLASLIGMVTTGGETAVMTAPKIGNEDEWRKRITSTLMGGPSVVLLDNIVEPLDSASLAAMLTAREWEDRRLGVSENVRLPVRAIWFGTGNNIQVQGDMPRRCYHIRIDSNLAQPWMREGFRHPNLREWIVEHRGKLLAALLIIARAWCDAGRPPWSGSPLGSFESWSRNVGGALEYAGLAGFLTNADRLYQEADEDTQQWAAFFEAWANTFGQAPVKVKDVCNEILKYAPPLAPTLLRSTLPSDLVTAVDKGAGNLSRRLGLALRARRDTVFGDCRLTFAGLDPHDKVALWMLTNSENAEDKCHDSAENTGIFAGSAGNENRSPAAFPADLNPFMR